MVLTDRQRADLHAGIYEYLLSRPGEHFAAAAAALALADPPACQAKAGRPPSAASAPILEKKWTAVPRLQKKVLELERAAAQSAKIHAHRAGMGLAGGDGAGGAGAAAGSAVGRRMIPRPPAVHTLKGHQGQVTCVAVHPVYTVAVSGSEDGTVKVSAGLRIHCVLLCVGGSFIPYHGCSQLIELLVSTCSSIVVLCPLALWVGLGS